MQLLAVNIKGMKRGLLGAMLCIASLNAQESSEPPVSSQHPANTVSDGGAPPVPEGGAGSSSAALEYLFSRKPQDGSLAQQAQQAQARMDDKAKAADALGLSRLEDPQVRARFERYLGMKEVEDSELLAYSRLREGVLESLEKDRLFEAWQKLRELSAYETIDAGVSLELANRIEAIWNTDRASRGIQNRNQQLRTEVRTATRNADMQAATVRDAELRWKQRNRESERKGNRPSNGESPQGGEEYTLPEPGASMAGLEGKLQLTEEYLRSLEAKAKIKLNELRAEKLLDAAKTDFASYINTLFGSRRHQHVVLAANFYRKIFNEAEYPVGIANQVNASLEMAREVKNTVEVFFYKLSRNELAGATDRLQEVFVIGEFDVSVLGVPRLEKEKVANFTNRLSQMRNLIEARDFGNLATLLDETKAIAIDFDSTKPMAIVNAVKLESKLRMGKAKLAAQQGDLKVAMEEFQAAAEAWPGNPELQDSAGTFFHTQDTKNQALVEFDRLAAEQNFRGIFERQLQFAPAVHGDTKREDVLKDALEKIKLAELAYEKANLLQNAGDIYGAWENVELAASDLPGDIKLNMLRAELSGKAAEFVAAVNKAKEAEVRKELGISLSCYAVAQRQYPSSSIANSGIQRVSDMILRKEKPL